MTDDKTHPVAWICMAIGLCLYGMALFHHQRESLQQSDFFTGGLPPSAQKALAGPFAGAAADLNLLGVFSIYEGIRRQPADNNALWHKLHARLLAAQELDPWFWDVYRLAVGLMAFRKQGTSAAVDLLSKGAAARTWDWEMPFMAGYLAHEFLHDDKRAAVLMSEAVKRPNAPPLAIGLASQFFNASEGPEASIRFLRYLRASMPAEYRAVIDARITHMEQAKVKKAHP
ncbi:hypothetical protein [Mariprofundus ferrooxydans]|nr:hypothetical protein [Mariprofundus ferrooxydans]